METQFNDRTLKCADCHSDFVFTAGEQLFFHDKQFKNDPKRCKPCKGRRSGLSAVANGTGPTAAGLSRTETRTECSECHVETTVPFKPTQGRPVLCRQCFQVKARSNSRPVSHPEIDIPVLPPFGAPQISDPASIYALTSISANAEGATLDPSAAVLAMASMAAASANSSVASVADLASIVQAEPQPARLLAASILAQNVPAALLNHAEVITPELLALAAEAHEA